MGGRVNPGIGGRVVPEYAENPMYGLMRGPRERSHGRTEAPAQGMTKVVGNSYSPRLPLPHRGPTLPQGGAKVPGMKQS